VTTFAPRTGHGHGANRMGGRAAREAISFRQTPYALEV
jgi:hypothetical protein